MAESHLVKYKLLEEVGHGGMAVVYRGLDTTLNREVAIKILHEHLAEQEESKQRFQREAHAVAKLRHDNIIEIYDYSGIDSPKSFIVTEFIHGQTLKDFLSRYPISHPEIAAMTIIEVCNALAHAHSLGVIHRDIKPENIMIRDDGRVKLTDFGIAQVIDVQRLTITGQLLGSPAYMAPELVEGKEIDFRSDIFSVGTLLYQLATSELPFKGKNPHEVLKRIAEGRYIDPEVANPVVGTQLAKIIRKSLAHDPADRYADIIKFKEDLLAFLSDININDSRSELAKYFQSPVEYSQQLQEQIVEILTQKGKVALQEKKTLRALDHFNRVLCVDPSNKEILALLDQLTRRRRFWRVLSVIFLALTLGVGAYLIAVYRPKGRVLIEVSAFRDARPSSAIEINRATDMNAPALRIDAKPSRSDLIYQDEGARPSLPNHPSNRIHHPLSRVKIIPTPKGVSIWLNGKALGAYGPNLQFLKIPMGVPSKLVFRNTSCFERVILLGPKKIPKVLRVQLSWKPARVSVNITPDIDADVMVGNLVTRPSQAVEVNIPPYSEDGHGEVNIKVSAEGFYTKNQKVQVRANRLTTIRVKLRRIP